MKTVKVKLSSAGVRQAVRQLREYEAKVRAAPVKIVEALTSFGEETAVMAVLPFAETGTLASSIKSEAGGNVGFVKCECGYAVYVEFGTGIKGAGSPHPDTAILGWKYDVNNHGELGWWYPTDESDPNPYKSRSKDGSLYAWTRGMPSRPFMYETAQKLRESVIPLARSVLQ